MKGENNMGKSMLNGVCYGSDSATDINYDNTSSGLTATNTQDAIDELNESLPFKLGVDSEGNYGYIKVGADTVTPFKKGYEDTPATALASQITEGYTAWVNGELIVGTRPAPITSVTGSISISQWDDRSPKSYSVTFATAFDNVPTVVITYALGASAYGITEVTRTGFTCWFRYDGDGSNGKVGNAYWSASL